MIDFGLSFTSTLAEDKAVDLYVLERAFSSTHPGSEALFAEVMIAYEKKSGKKAWAEVGRRLEDGQSSPVFSERDSAFTGAGRRTCASTDACPSSLRSCRCSAPARTEEKHAWMIMGRSSGTWRVEMIAVCSSRNHARLCRRLALRRPALTSDAAITTGMTFRERPCTCSAFSDHLLVVSRRGGLSPASPSRVPLCRMGLAGRAPLNL